MLYERGVLKNLSKFSYKYNESTGGVLSKDVPKNFVKFTEETSFPLFPFLKSCRNLKPAEAAAGDL